MEVYKKLEGIISLQPLLHKERFIEQYNGKEDEKHFEFFYQPLTALGPSNGAIFHARHLMLPGKGQFRESDCMFRLHMNGELLLSLSLTTHDGMIVTLLGVGERESQKIQIRYDIRIMQEGVVSNYVVAEIGEEGKRRILVTPSPIFLHHESEVSGADRARILALLNDSHEEIARLITTGFERTTYSSDL